MSERRPSIALAIALYCVLWTPALLLAGFVSFMGFIGTGFSPLWVAMTFLLALPFVLIGIGSFRLSAAMFALSLCWDIVGTTWPHVSLSGFFDSTIDALLFSVTTLTVLVAAFSPFRSLIHFFRYERPI
jgi:hypothetical protein